MRRAQRVQCADLGEELEAAELWAPILRASAGDSDRAPAGLVEVMGDDTAAWLVQPDHDDHYVVVDERDGAELLLVVSTWPHVASDGWVVFPDDVEQHGADAREMQPVLDEQRREFGQLERPLRVGDAFLRRAAADRDIWLDVTEAAREQAKVATFSAAACARTQRPEPVGSAPEQVPVPPAVAASLNVARPAL